MLMGKFLIWPAPSTHRTGEWGPNRQQSSHWTSRQSPFGPFPAERWGRSKWQWSCICLGNTTSCPDSPKARQLLTHEKGRHSMERKPYSNCKYEDSLLLNYSRSFLIAYLEFWYVLMCPIHPRLSWHILQEIDRSRLPWSEWPICWHPHQTLIAEGIWAWCRRGSSPSCSPQCPKGQCYWKYWGRSHQWVGRRSHCSTGRSSGQTIPILTNTSHIGLSIWPSLFT